MEGEELRPRRGSSAPRLEDELPFLVTCGPVRGHPHPSYRAHPQPRGLRFWGGLWQGTCITAASQSKPFPGTVPRCRGSTLHGPTWGEPLWAPAPGWPKLALGAKAAKD